MATSNPYAVGLERVNDASVSPLNFLYCAAFIYPKRISVIRASKHYTRKKSDNRCRPLASVLNSRGTDKGNTVAVLRTAAAMFDCHFGTAALANL